MYWDYLDFPKKILMSRGPNPYVARDPQKQLLGVLGPIEGRTPRGPRPQKFFWGSLGSPTTYIIYKLGG